MGLDQGAIQAKASIKSKRLNHLYSPLNSTNKDILIDASQISKNYITKGGKGQNESILESKVQDVSFSIFENEIMGILGPSGAGKSSIFKMMTMAMNRSGGKIDLLGQSFDSPSVNDMLTRGDIGIVYQDDVMWPELTVD